METENNFNNSNKLLWENYQKEYQSLTGVNYENNELIFPDGRKISGIDISVFPPSTFSMSPDNLYIYLSNGFAKHDEANYNAELDYIYDLLTQIIITDDEENALKKFAYDFLLRTQLFYSEKTIAADDEYMKEFKARRKAITEAYRGSSAAANIIITTYNQALQELNARVTQANEEQAATQAMEEENSLEQSQGLELTRSKSGLPKTIPEEPSRQGLGIAGSVSIIFLMGAVIIAGIYLALAIIG